MNRTKRIAILGAGPIGLEAALYGLALGHSPIVYERGEVGANLSRWGFLTLFSPWKLNVSPLGLDVLRRQGEMLPDPDAFPTAAEFRQRYLLPHAASLGEAVKTGVEVAGVSKLGLLKGENIGGMRRARTPFRLLLRRAGREEEASADVVLDATGVYANPNSLGDGGIPAVGEISNRELIDYHLLDVQGADRKRYAKKTILLVGSGFSAATSLLALVSLLKEEPSTRIIWARRSCGPDPFPTYSPDPLPERSRLGHEGNRIAANPPAGSTVLAGVAVKAVERTGDGLRVELRPLEGGATPQAVLVDRIIANVGYRPDIEIYRELQVHQCYASEGPMSLAAALLERAGKGGKGEGGDCLAQVTCGPNVLKNPEPGFFILGHKSYGRRSDFLLRMGLEQVRDVFRLLEQDPELDLYNGRTQE